MISYRIRQFMQAVRGRVTPAEWELVQRTLPPAELRLFQAMPRYDQRHCLDVYWTLWHAGQRAPLLLRAALVHDCGKIDDQGRPMQLTWYMLVTLLRIVRPLYVAAAASGRGPFLPVRIYAEHAWRGSRMLAAANAPAEIVAMVRHYHDPAPQGDAAILQWADNQN
jgi:hypothetical protein